jgi:Cu-Zn family superoxide dismutase
MKPTHSIVRLAAAAVAFTAIGCSDNSSTIAPSSAPLASRSGNPGALPDQYILPGNAVFPEGIAYDQRSGSVFVSSTTDGTIFRGDVTSETLTPFLAGNVDGRTTAIGLAIDDRGRLYVAGGGTGLVFVYDGATGALIAKGSSGATPTFINDIVVAPDGSAYATDSQSPFIYRINRDASGNFTLERWLNLTGTAFVSLPGFNANGIEVTPNGRYLILIQSNTGKLFRIDIETRAVTQFDLGGATFPSGDGILLQGTTLFVLQNSTAVLSEIRLDVAHATGTVVGSTTDPSFAFPTSLDFARGRLLVVNSQFNRRGPGLTPALPFTVSVVKRP